MEAKIHLKGKSLASSSPSKVSNSGSDSGAKVTVKEGGKDKVRYPSIDLRQVRKTEMF